MKKIALLFVLSTIFGCAGTNVRRLADVQLGGSDLPVASAKLAFFQTTSGLSVAPVVYYAAFTADTGGLNISVRVAHRCYVLVGTTENPDVQIAVGMTNKSGRMVNSGLQRNDSYQARGLAARGFCPSRAGYVTLGAVTSGPRMGMILALYQVQSAGAMVAVIASLQNLERREMMQLLSRVATGSDHGASLVPWGSDLPGEMARGQTVIANLPAGAEAGQCLLVAVTGSGGADRDVDLYVFTGDVPSSGTLELSPVNTLAMDPRVNPTAAVVFAVPADPSSVHVAVQSYAGSGSVAYAAYRVRSGLCEARLPVQIPELDSGSQ